MEVTQRSYRPINSIKVSYVTSASASCSPRNDHIRKDYSGRSGFIRCEFVMQLQNEHFTPLTLQLAISILYNSWTLRKMHIVHAGHIAMDIWHSLPTVMLYTLEISISITNFSLYLLLFRTSNFREKHQNLIGVKRNTEGKIIRNFYV